MEKALVTGATGFVGGNLVRELLQQGFRVRALVRPGSKWAALEQQGVEVMQGDVTDRESVAQAVKGVEYVFHTAALYSFWARDSRDFYRVNVEGTRVLLEEGMKAGVKRVVYTSTASILGGRYRGPRTEESLARLEDLPGHYRKSKLLAEEEVLRLVARGLPAVIVNPTAPVGQGDVKPTPTGRMVLDYLRGRMVAYIDVGLNLVDVEDVARGHVLALRKGRTGERYILGGKNMSLKDVMTTLQSITGRRGPRWKAPYPLALSAACVSELVEGRLLRRKPTVPLAGVMTARRPEFVDCSKAIRELGLSQSPVEGALARAVLWFQDNGYV